MGADYERGEVIPFSLPLHTSRSPITVRTQPPLFISLLVMDVLIGAAILLIFSALSYQYIRLLL